MLRIFMTPILFVMLAGCAELFLDERINSTVTDPVATGRTVTSTAPTSVQMPQAIAYALNMSEAYKQAARNAVIAQDATAGLLIVAAASTALGAIDEVADDVLARRATVALTVQQIGQRGLARDAIKSLYLGARQTNCVATVATLNSEIDDQKAGLVTALFVKDIEYRIREGLVRDVPDFSALQTAISAAVGDTPKTLDSNGANLTTYVAALQGCLKVDDKS